MRNDDRRADERLTLAREEGQRAATRLASEMSAAEAAQEAERIGNGLRAAAVAAQRGPEAWDQVVTSLGMTDLVGQHENADIILAPYEGAYEVLQERSNQTSSFIVAGEDAARFNLPTDGTAFNIETQGQNVSASPIGNTTPPDPASRYEAIGGTLYDMTPEGGGAPQPIGGEGVGPNIAGETDLRSEWNKLPPVRDFQTQAAAMGRISAAAGTNSGPGDIALIFNYMKLLDPGSVVREGEFATAETAGGVSEQVRGLYNRLINGERLTPEMRQEFLRAAGQVYGSAEQGYVNVRDQYAQIARRYNLNPDEVLTDYRFSGELPGLNTAASNGAAPTGQPQGQAMSVQNIPTADQIMAMPPQDAQALAERYTSEGILADLPDDVFRALIEQTRGR